MNTLWSSMAKRTKPYVPGEQPQDLNTLKLNTNENPYPPSPAVIQAIKNEAKEKLHLYPSPTLDQLKEKLAAYHSLTKDNIFIGNGSDEVLAFSFMAFFEPGRKILFPEITYSFYPVYATLYNIPYEEVPLKRDFSLKAGDYFQSEGGVIFPNPNAPTSIFLPVEQIEDIVKTNKNKVVIIDEAYIDFATQSAVSLINQYNNLLIVQTMSKSRSLAGLRVGFALGHPTLIEALIRIKNSFNSYTLDQLAIVGAEAAIDDNKYTEKITKKIIKTRTWVSQQMKQKGFYVIPSQTNFIFVQHVKFNAEQLFTLLKKKKILVRHFNINPIKDYIRITIGTDADMMYFLETLTEIMEKEALLQK